MRSRRLIALFAAYVVALQALLLPLSVAFGSPTANGLCAASTDGSASPASHESGCPCAAGCGMLCCAHALGGPAHVGGVIAGMHASTTVSEPLLAPIGRRIDARGRQNPRAPPAT